MMESFIGQLDAAAPALLLSSGLVIGLVHAFEPDHMAAVLTQSVRGGRGRRSAANTARGAARGSLLGALWGLGHTSMVLLVGLLVFVFSLRIPDPIFDGFEMGVGAMLVVLGISVYLRRGAIRSGHSHPHTHDSRIVHSHPHTHDGGHVHNHHSYLIGCLHGLAGSGALVALGVSALADIGLVLYFLLIFGLGSVAGMILASGAFSIPLVLAGGMARMGRIIRVAVGVVSVAIGIDIIYGLLAGGGFFGII